MRRRGFTLIELVSSLAVMSVLMTALGSVIVLATRTLPSGDRESDIAAALARALDVIRDDLRYATSITVADGRGVSMVVPDRDADDVDEIIKYTWDGTAGEPLRRVHEGIATTNLIGSIDEFEIGWIEGDAVVDSTQIRIRIGQIEVGGRQRAFNAESGV